MAPNQGAAGSTVNSASVMRGKPGGRNSPEPSEPELVSLGSDTLVTCCLRYCVEGVVSVFKTDLETYMKSLIWPFVLWNRFFPGSKEFHRFCQSMRQTSDELLKVMDEKNSEQDLLKYWLNVFLCQVFRDDQRPERPPQVKGPLFFGWCRRFVARRIAKRDVKFIYSLGKGSKIAWPRLGEWKEKSTLEKHEKNLSREPKRIPIDVAQEIGRVSRFLFSSSVKEMGTKFCPSGSACLQAGRREGGALALFEPFHQGMENQKQFGILRGLNIDLEGWRKEQYSACFDRVAVGPTDKLFDVRAVTVPEPGKWRIVTAGDGNLYSLLQPLQGQMLSAWKRTPFSSMLHDNLLQPVRDLDSSLPEVPRIVSVDYESATDLLEREATLLALSGCSASPLHGLAVASFSSGSCFYRKLNRTTVLRNGQPMGHPLSFPLLCCINLAVYFAALRRWQVKYSVPQDLVDRLAKAVYVNGDDMLFKCFPTFRPIFTEVAASVGFKESLGKNYDSPDTCMMNSQVFRRVGGKMEPMGYFNQRFLSGQNVKTGDSSALPTQIGKDVDKMIRICPKSAGAVPAIFKRWSHDRFGFRPNWYLPVILGGFGLGVDLAPPGMKITREQRLVAAYFASNPSLALYRVLGGTSTAVRAPDAALLKPKIVLGDYVEREHEHDMDSDDWVARFALANRIAQPGESDRVLKAVKIPKRYGIKPMSLERIDMYRHPRIFVQTGVPCPPLGHIAAPDLQRLRGLIIRSTESLVKWLTGSSVSSKSEGSKTVGQVVH